jgi:hypothetical protein
MRELFLILLFGSALFAEPVHSSLSTFYQNMEFKNSKQKTDGKTFGLGADIHVDESEYRFVFTNTYTNTRQPPLNKDLEVQKLYLRYGYIFDESFKVNLNYINVLKDNIVSTAHGEVYGGGVSYAYNKMFSLNLTQFFSDYKEFDAHQSDLSFDIKMKLKDVKVKLTSVTSYISLDDNVDNSLTKNADKYYVTSALKLHSHYKTYHLGAAYFFGKRLFAVMNDGFSLQHHAMEFDKTYVLGFGKTFSDLIVRAQYVYQRAEELPIKNSGVEINNIKLILNYKY